MGKKTNSYSGILLNNGKGKNIDTCNNIEKSGEEKQNLNKTKQNFMFSKEARHKTTNTILSRELAKEVYGDRN